MVTPGEFGLARDKSLKLNGNFLPMDKLNASASLNLLELQYNNLKNLVYSNLGENLCYKPRGEADPNDTKPYFRVSLRELYLKDKKGSKNFRNVFKYNITSPIDYGEAAWKKLLVRKFVDKNC